MNKKTLTLLIVVAVGPVTPALVSGYEELQVGAPETKAPPRPSVSRPAAPVIQTAPLSVEQQQEKIQKEAQKEAYKQTLDQMLPLSPWQIRHFQERRKKTLEAIRSDGVPPQSTISTHNLSLDSGSKINTLFLTPGFVTAVSFFDSTGAPWPLNTVTVGNPNWFHIVTEVFRGGAENNILSVQALTGYASSNLIITLRDWPVPVAINVVTDDFKDNKNQNKSNTNIIMRANRPGPLAKKATVGPQISSDVSAELLDFLSGIPPAEAAPIKKVSDTTGYKLWRFQGALFFRTRHPVIWPAWDQIVHGAGGVMLYRLPEVVSIVVSEDGKKRKFEF